PEMREVRLELFLGHEPHPGALLLARLREDELTTVGEAGAEHLRLRTLRSRRQVAQPYRAHEVDAEHEVLVLDGEQEVLAPAARALEAAAVELLERRRERLERGDVRRARLLDGRA